MSKIQSNSLSRSGTASSGTPPAGSLNSRVNAVFQGAKKVGLFAAGVAIPIGCTLVGIGIILVIAGKFAGPLLPIFWGVGGGLLALGGLTALIGAYALYSGKPKQD